MQALQQPHHSMSRATPCNTERLSTLLTHRLSALSRVLGACKHRSRSEGMIWLREFRIPRNLRAPHLYINSIAPFTSSLLRPLYPRRTNRLIFATPLSSAMRSLDKPLPSQRPEFSSICDFFDNNQTTALLPEHHALNFLPRSTKDCYMIWPYIRKREVVRRHWQEC